MLEDEPPMFTTSADKRLPASSKLVRVRVEASKNTLMMVLPRRAGDLAHGAPRDLQERLRQIEQALGGLARELLDAEQVTNALFSHGTSGRGAPGGIVGEFLGMTTAKMPDAFSNTSMRSSGLTVSVLSA